MYQECLCTFKSFNSHCGWTNSLKDKMGNYRSKMRSLGHTDVTVNAGKRGRYSTSSDPPNKNIKKPRKGETAIGRRNEEKKNPDAVFINQKMDMTLSLRRQEVVINKPPVGQILQRWPALFRESQVYQEFNQIVGKNLKQEFYGSLDRHCPQLIQIFRSRRTDFKQSSARCQGLYMPLFTSDLTDMRCVAIRGLPVLLGDDPTEFFRACFASDDGDSYQHVPVGILN
ncbi:Teneurin-4 [Labeo rohita]|uniref:Teneurin-4 n=1 Tax=Labeo rohita TaxID=84645 RepID=A0ABQ8MMM0_LABRO|nr:Teneurin-4 [Labeo rohita]